MNKQVQWNVVKITVPCEIGGLNEKKMEVLTKQLNSNGIEVNARFNAPNRVAIFILQNRTDNLMVAPNQFTYVSSVGGNGFRWEEIKKNIKVILDALLIDDDLRYVFNFEGSCEAADSHCKSKEEYVQNFNKDLPEDVFGVGYRFLIKNENFEGDYKVEPMINDNSKQYYQLILNTINSGSIESAIGAVKTELEK